MEQGISLKTRVNKVKPSFRFVIFFFSILLYGNSLFAQTVSVNSPANCFATTFDFALDVINSPDATGRNVYYYSNSSLEIRYNNAASRWEIRARGGNFDIYYVNSFASSPNPPDSTTSPWDDFGFCDNTGAPTVSGDGTQSTIGNDPCDNLGGDTDNDGACDDNDNCPGFDDFADQDLDGIPDGCDANPTVPDGVLVNATCLSPDPILFTLSGTDGTGRNVYSTTFANGLEVRYNDTDSRWEVRASGGAMDVYLYNTYASSPNPPGSAGTWVGTSVLNCDTTQPIVSGSGTQASFDYDCLFADAYAAGANAYIDLAGDGFGPWNLVDTNAGDPSQSGFFVATSTANGDGDSNFDDDIDSAGVAFGLYANSGQQTDAIRDFDVPMGTGDIFSIDMDNGWIENGGVVGLSLQNATGANLIEFYFTGGISNYTLNDSGGVFDTGIPFTDEGLSLSFEVTSAGMVDVEVIDLATGTVSNFSRSLFNPGDQVIGRIRMFNFNAGSDAPRNAYFNKLQHCIDTSVDNTPPDITCPHLTGTTVSADENCQSILIDYTSDATVSDDKSETQNITVTQNPLPGAVLSLGENQITLTATDEAGNSTECNFMVTVNDTEAPTAVCVEAYTVELDDTGNATINASVLNGGSTDNCSTNLTYTVNGQPTVSFSCSDVSQDFGDQVWINEFHYDNDGTDAGEFIEVVANFDASAYQIVLYNGSGGAVYDTDVLSSGTLTTVQGYNFYTINYPSNGIQNGAPDGIALADGSGVLVEFLSYEGSFVGVGGPAGGISSTDVGVIETDDPPLGRSLQLTGSGFQASDFSWTGPIVATPGAINSGQSLSSLGTEVTLTVADENGNTNTCKVNVKVLDKIAPTASCVSELTIQLDETGNATITADDIDDGSSDVCGDVTLSIDIESFDCSNVGSGNTVTLTVTDESGNESTCQVDVTVEDNVDPVAVCNDITVELDENGEATINASALNGGSTDNCSTNLTYTVNGQPTVSFSCVDASQDFGDQVWINEFHYDNASIDTGEFIEVVANFDASAYQIVLYNGANGMSYNTTVLSSATLTTVSGYNIYTLSIAGIQNGAPDGIAFIDGSNSVMEFLSYEGSFTALNGPAIGMISMNIGVNEPDSTPVGQSLQLTGSGFQASDFSWTGPIVATPGAVNSGQSLSSLGTEVTLTVADESGNVDTCTAYVTVVDNSDPTITCVDDQTKSTDEGECYYTVSGTEFDPTFGDNCSGSTITNDYNDLETLDGATFPFGTTTVIWTVTDASNNTATCSFDVIVNKVTPKITVSVVPDEQQYSDLVTFTATVLPIENCSGAGTICGLVTFKVNGQTMGTAPVISGVATLANIPLLELPLGTYPGNGSMDPAGTETVEAILAACGDYVEASDASTDALDITCEDASVVNTGGSYFTANPNNGEGTVALSAFVVDDADGNRGDIRNATVTFHNEDINGSALGTPNIPVGLIDSNIKTDGFATTDLNYTLNTNEQTGGGKVWTVFTTVNNYYCGATDEATVVTLAMPGPDFVTGGGHILQTNTSGQYPGLNNTGKKMNFGFVMKWNKSGKNLQGNVNVIYRGPDGNNYQIKSNAINSLAVGATTGFKTATITTKANLKRIFPDGTFESIAGNLSLVVIAYESTTDITGKSDKISVQLAGEKGSGIYFSSNWSSGKTQLQQLNGGKIQIRSANSSSSRTSDATAATTVDTASGTFELQAWPNPSKNEFNIKLNSANKVDKMEIHVYDINGRQVYYNAGKSGEEYQFGSNLESGVYFMNVAQADKSLQVKLIKY